MKRCPSCGGLNPEAANWCGQCHARFAPAAPPVPPPPPAVPLVPTPPDGPAPDGPPAGMLGPRAGAEGGAFPGSDAGAERGAFTVTEVGVLWRCATCGSQNPIAVDVCATCGARLRDIVVPEEAPARRAGSPRTAAAISLMFPGAGHAYLGIWGQAIARAAIALWVVGTILATLSVGGDSKAMTWTFAVAALGLWAVSAHDALQEASGRPGAAILKGRAFLYLVLGLLLIMMLLALATAT